MTQLLVSCPCHIYWHCAGPRLCACWFWWPLGYHNHTFGLANLLIISLWNVDNLRLYSQGRIFFFPFSPVGEGIPIFQGEGISILSCCMSYIYNEDVEMVQKVLFLFRALPYASACGVSFLGRFLYSSKKSKSQASPNAIWDNRHPSFPMSSPAGNLQFQLCANACG